MNYAAQVAKQFTTIVTERKAAISKMEYGHCQALVDKIERATHLILPDEGRIFQDRFRGIRDRELHMPFPIMTLEYHVDPEQARKDGLVHPAKRLIVLEEHTPESLNARQHDRLSLQAYNDIKKFGGRAIVVSAFYGDDDWVPCVSSWVLFKQWDNKELFKETEEIPTLVEPSDKAYPICGFMLIEFPTAFSYIALNEGVDAARKNAANDIMSEVMVALETLEALSCSNVEATVVQEANPKLNAKRMRQGKLPFYETRCLTLHVPVASARSLSKGGTHASPRQHLRRGHIRRLQDRNIWVNSCVVGSAERGIIVKDYVVTA